MTHICVSKLTNIGSDNGLSPGRRQVIIWTNTGMLLIGPLGTNFSEILIEIHTISFKKIHLKISSGWRWPFCLGLNVLSYGYPYCKNLRWRHVSVITWPQATILIAAHFFLFVFRNGMTSIPGHGVPVKRKQGLYSLRRRRLISIGIPIINLTRSLDRLRFIMGIPIPVRRRPLSE